MPAGPAEAGPHATGSVDVAEPYVRQPLTERSAAMSLIAR
jgi:hypothetical protein